MCFSVFPFPLWKLNVGKNVCSVFLFCFVFVFAVLYVSWKKPVYLKCMLYQSLCGFAHHVIRFQKGREEWRGKKTTFDPDEAIFYINNAAMLCALWGELRGDRDTKQNILYMVAISIAWISQRITETVTEMWNLLIYMFIDIYKKLFLL